jgi:UDP-glucose:(heptosyl)LPS alpha-1,3-glucosyltransferase
MAEGPESIPVPESVPPVPRLRIAVFNRTFDPSGGGAERYSIALVEQLAARHEMHVFAQEIKHQWPGITYHRISMPLRKPRWVNQLWFATATWWATRSGFDVVHSHENTWHGNVQTVHVLPVWHNLFHGRTGWGRALRWLNVITSPRLITYLALESLRFTLSKVPHKPRLIAVTSDSLRQVMAQTFPRAATALQVLVPGVALPETVTTPDQRRAARAALGLPQDASCLLLVGNDYRKKGLKCLLEACKRLPAVTLAVVGHRHQQAEFFAMATTLGLEKNVFFLGSLPDVTPAYQAADVLVHPTLEDTFAMVVLEAMSHGLPVVVSGPAFCGIAGLLSDGQNALLLPDPQDATLLANALARILGDDPLRICLGTNARRFAVKHAWAEKVQAQEALYLPLR